MSLHLLKLSQFIIPQITIMKLINLLILASFFLFLQVICDENTPLTIQPTINAIDHLHGQSSIESMTLTQDGQTQQEDAPQQDHQEAGTETEKQQEKQDKQEKQEPKHSTHIPGVGLSIVFIFGSLLYGSILKMISRFTSIPYNPLLLISGILLGMNYEHLGLVGLSIELISKASPEGILAIFLPILIYESAFKTEWHVFKKLAGQSLIMGILSSITSATLIMLFVKLVIDPQHKYYRWDSAFLMGSILTCTDILSFVHKLKRAGTPQKLTSLLEGESLFNYCTCVLIVELIHHYREDNQFDGFWEYFKLLVIEISGGIVVGVVAGIILVYCIKRMIYDGTLVAALTVIFTYTIYLVAQFSTLRISGIVSLAVFALYMNAFGKTWLFGQTQEIVSSFWGYLIYVAETNIFMIAGVMVGASMLHFSSASLNIYNQLFSTLYIYLFVLFARFVSISLFIKYLRKLGEGLAWKEVFVLTFTGLKGAIGIALAMQMYRSKDFDHIISYLIMMHVTSNSLITLVIHGTTAGLVVKAFGLTSQKKVQYKFFKQYLYSFKASVFERMQHMKQQCDEHSMIEWSEVETQTGLHIYQKMAQETDQKITHGQFEDESKFQKSQMFKLENVLKDCRVDVANLDQGVTDKNARFDMQVQFRKRFLKDLIAKYWEFHDANETTPAALMLLIQSANYDLDREAEEIQSWNWIKNQISFNMRIFSEFMKVTIVNELAKSSLFEYVSFCYDVVSSYIKANEEVREELFEFYNKSQHKNEDEQRLILMNILRESQQNQKQAEFFLINYLQPSFPQIEKEVKTRKVSFFILHTFKDIIDKNNQNGQLQPNEYDMLNHIIDSKSLELNLSSPKWEESDLFQILSEDKERNVFKNIPGPILQLLSNELGQNFTFDANERVMDNNEIAKYFFFVKKGGCIVQFTNQSLVYKQPMLAGQCFGFQSLVTNLYHSKATANTMAQIIQVKKGLILKIFDAFPKIQQAFWKTNIFQCYKMFVKKDDISYRISHVHKEEIEEMISHFRLKRIQPKVIEQLEEDMIFIRGNMEFTDKQERKATSHKQGSKDNENSLPITESATPFYFASRLKDNILKIKEPSLFLVGELDYQQFESVSMRLSRNTNWKGKKRSIQKTHH